MKVRGCKKIGGGKKIIHRNFSLGIPDISSRLEASVFSCRGSLVIAFGWTRFNYCGGRIQIIFSLVVNNRELKQ